MSEQPDLTLILAKVKKLLRLAAGNANLHEAASAAAKAQALVDRYKLHLMELDDEVETPGNEVLYESGKAVIWKELLATRLAAANGCHVWITTPSPGLRKEGVKPRVHVVGTPSSTTVMRFMFVTLAREIERLSRLDWSTNQGFWMLKNISSQAHALDFKKGAVKAIGDRLKKERDETRLDYALRLGPASVTALARFDSEAADAKAWLEEAMQKEGLALYSEKRETTPSSKTAWDQGYKAGTKIPMSKALGVSVVKGGLKQ